MNPDLSHAYGFVLLEVSVFIPFSSKTAEEMTDGNRVVFYVRSGRSDIAVVVIPEGIVVVVWSNYKRNTTSVIDR